MSEAFLVWIQPNLLAGSRAAVDTADALEWAKAGITLVLNLREEPDDLESLRQVGLRCAHFPVPDFSAPSQELLAHAIAEIAAEIEAGGRVAVHCHAGLGRTGTVLATWLVHHGAKPEDAIAQVRALRPGSIETQDQEEAVRAYYRSRQEQWHS